MVTTGLHPVVRIGDQGPAWRCNRQDGPVFI